MINEIAAGEGPVLALGAQGRDERVLANYDEGSPERARWGPPYDARFSPLSDRLVLSTLTGRLVAVDTTTWQPVVERRLDLENAEAVGLVGHAADGSLVIVNPLYENAANASLVLVDPRSFDVRRVWSGVAEGSAHAAAVSPDGTRVAIAASEGVVNVWDLESQALVDRADPGLDSLHGVQWLDDQTLALLSVHGHLSTVTTDGARLLDQARDSLTRGLTQTECVTYLVSPCPGLAELRGSAPVVPEELRGSYELAWGADEFAAVVTDRARQSYGRLSPASVRALTEQARQLAGDYRLTLRESDYTVTRGRAGEVWCTGSVERSDTRPDRLLLGADSGSRCTDFHYAEVGWEIDGDRLALPGEEFRGRRLDTLLWTSKPLVRVGEDSGEEASP